jgi:hypothetical protein
MFFQDTVARRTTTLIGAQLLLALTAQAAVRAQSPRAATLIGTVRDTSGAPIAQVRLTSSGLLTISDSAGRFSLGPLPGGATTLLVRRLGFEPLDIGLTLSGGIAQSLNVVLTVLPQDLPGMTTYSQTYAEVRLRDFYRHRQSGIGYFLDRREIESKNAQRISDILRRVPGTRMMPDRGGRTTMRMARSAGGRDCPPDVWVDGVRASGMQVDDVPLGDVEALELYRGPAGLPPEMNSRFGNPGCGALIIWTRLPG